MGNLLSAGFFKLKKSKIFWLGMLVMFGYGLLAVFSRYRDLVSSAEYPYRTPDGLLFSGGIMLMFVTPIFIGLFIGTEYSDGTIRNKLLVGHTRVSVYLSNLIVCMTATVLMHLIYLVIIIGIGIPVIGKFEDSTDSLIKMGFCSFLMVIALTAFLLLFSMLIQSKANSSVTAIILSLILLFGAMVIQQRLDAPEYYEGYSYMTESGELVTMEAQKNPHYLEGTERKVYEFLLDFLPSGQMVQFSRQEVSHMARLPIYSAILFILSTGCGIVLFQKKDLR